MDKPIDYWWDWKDISGSPECIASNRRDLLKLDVVLKLVRRRKSVIQAGGNLGLFPKRLSREFKAVYTFEPDPELFAIMCRNAPEENIIKFQAALGENAEFVSTKRGRHEGTTYTVDSGIIPTLQIDTLGIGDCDLLYLDIEGRELFALSGASFTITKSKPVIVCEINETADRYGVSRGDIDGYLRSALGYVKVLSLYTDEVYMHWQHRDEELINAVVPELNKINRAGICT